MPRTRSDRHQAKCKECGKTFFQRKPDQEYCSQACSNKAFPGTGGRKPVAGLPLRICANEKCGKEFQPYRANQVACSRRCYGQLPEVRARQNAARRTPEFRERKNKWRREDSQQQERMRAYNRKRQFRDKYGITVEEFEAKLEAQGGACMLCRRPPNPNGVRATASLHQDHDHVTGKNRDLLCSSCNLAIGMLQDDPDLIRKAADYIERHRSQDLLSKTEQAVWNAWKELPDEDPSPVKRIARNLNMEPVDVAFVVYPAEKFGRWADGDEPDLM